MQTLIRRLALAQALGACVLAACASGAHAGDRLLVQVPAQLDPAAPITESVKNKCAVEAKIGELVFKKISEKFPAAEPLADPRKAGADRLLKLTIVNVVGVGGGAWSGSKSITLRADLEQNSKVHASKLLTRQSGGGAFGGMKGTCSIMERIAAALGSDVAAWVPTALAMLPPAGTPAPAAAPAPESVPAPAAPETK